MRFLQFDGDHGTVLGEKIEHVGFLKGIRQLVNVKIGKVGLGFGVVSFSFRHLLVRSLVLGDAQAVRVLLHGCIVPSLNANFCSFGGVEVDKSKLLASASHSIEENDATENEVSLLSWLFAFLIRLISLVSKNNVELIDNLLLSAHRV